MPDTRQPPQDLEAEENLLGAMLHSTCQNDLGWDLNEVRALVRGEMLYTPQHRTIFAAICEATDAGEPVDYVGIVPRLRAKDPRDDWEDVTARLCDCADYANAPFYARKVRRAWQNREVVRAALEAIDDAYHPLGEPAEVIAALSRRLDTIDQSGQTDREPIPEAKLLRELGNPAERTRDAVPVALGHLGEVLDGGLDRGTLTVIGARPSCGKTSLGLGLCVHAVKASSGCSSLFVSAEMSAEQVGLRLLSMRSGLSMHKLRTGEIPNEQFIAARNEAALMAETSNGRRLYVLDGTTDCRAVIAHARRAVRRLAAKLIVIDYLSRLDIVGHFDRNDLRVAAISKAFKDLAVETHTAVVLLVQLNRASENESRRPRLADLRDSGCIEADADVVILIHRERASDDVEPSPTTLIIAKHRQGNTGDAPLLYRRSTMAYVAAAAREGYGRSVDEGA